MKHIFIIILFVTTFIHSGFSQSARERGYTRAWIEVDTKGDSVQHFEVLAVHCFRRKADMRKHQRLIAAVIKVYPVAQEARIQMNDMEEVLMSMPSKREQKKYINMVEERVKAEYTPVLKKMTRYQGKILLKLIDRQTDYTSYELLKEFRGGFVAGFWQGIAKVFGADLKVEYDKEGEDKALEQIVLLYEAGLL